MFCNQLRVLIATEDSLLMSEFLLMEYRIC